MRKKRTEAQLYSEDFEKLSTEIVNYLFKDSKCTIEKTKPSKDGGYDIVVECHDSNYSQKVYFECKLRSGNLGLRDISANIIIAHTEGAVALVILTNYDYTPQASENIGAFYQNTNLNIKIITGTDIQLLKDDSVISIIPKLEKIVRPRKNLKKKEYQFLRLDLEKPPFHHQILQKENVLQSEDGRDHLAKFKYESLLNAFKKESDWIRNILNQGRSVCVIGEEGIGKTSFIKEILNSNPEWTALHVKVDLYPGQSQFLLKLLLTIWGIPTTSIIEDFSDEEIDNVIGKIAFKDSTSKCDTILRRLFGDKKIHGIIDENYNGHICDYILEQVKLHHSRISYVFFFENFTYANDEIQTLVVYLCKLFSNADIPFILEGIEELYPNLEISSIKTIKLGQLPDPFVHNFVKNNLKRYTKLTSEKIVSISGSNLLGLNAILDYANNSLDIHLTDNPLIHELEAMDYHNVPEAVKRRLKIKREENQDLFDYLYLLNSHFPIVLLEEMPEQNDALDTLISDNLFELGDRYVVPTTQMIKITISNLIVKGSLRLRRSAEKLLSCLEKLPAEACELEKIKIYLFLNRHMEMIALMDNYILKLKETRDYTNLLQILESAITSLKKLPEYSQTCIKYIIDALDIYLIRKEINIPQSKELMKDLKELISFETESAEREYLMSIYDYFIAKVLFKDSKFLKTEELCKPYYEKSIEEKYKDHSSKIDGKIGTLYALSVKELYGDDSAKLIFEKLYQSFPDELLIAKEYYSHLACMNFYSDPVSSVKYIEKILALFKDKTLFELPYHEYGDLAMCHLLKKDFKQAIRSADDAIKISESNGVMAELGRANNIKSFALQCLNEYDQAEHLAKESFWILEEFRYPLYSWRSQLNYVQILFAKDNKTKKTENLLDDVYHNFFVNCKQKIVMLLETENYMNTREYHALVLLGKLYKDFNKDISDIVNDFCISSIANSYYTHIDELLGIKPIGPLFKTSPYYHNGIILVVG